MLVESQVGNTQVFFFSNYTSPAKMLLHVNLIYLYMSYYIINIEREREVMKYPHFNGILPSNVNPGSIDP